MIPCGPARSPDSAGAPDSSPRGRILGYLEGLLLISLLLFMLLNAPIALGLYVNVTSESPLDNAVGMSLRISKDCGSTFYPGQSFYVYVKVSETSHVVITVTWPDGVTVKLSEFDLEANYEVPRGPVMITGDHGEGRGIVRASASSIRNRCVIAEMECHFEVRLTRPTTTQVDPFSLSLSAPQISCRRVTINGVVEGASKLRWDWGDGHEDYQWLPASHEYSKDGNYTVRVKAYSQSGLSSQEKTLSILIQCNQPPVPRLLVSPHRVNLGESVVFDASGSYDPDGGTLEYYFDFGDGLTYGWTTEAKVYHSYGAVGTFTARVMVRDEEGAINLSYASVEVTRPPPEMQNLSYTSVEMRGPNATASSGADQSVLMGGALLLLLPPIALYSLRRTRRGGGWSKDDEIRVLSELLSGGHRSGRHLTSPTDEQGA